MPGKALPGRALRGSTLHQTSDARHDLNTSRPGSAPRARLQPRLGTAAEAAQRPFTGRCRAASSLATRAARQSQSCWEPRDETGLPQIEHEVMHVVDRRLLLAHLEGEDVADRDDPYEPSVTD